MGALSIPQPFPSSILVKPTSRTLASLTPRASSSNPPPSSDDPPSSSSSSAVAPDADFESRISRVSRKYRSGTGKKAEQRRARKGKSSSSSSSSSVLLPPIPLREPKARGGVRVEFGFSPYSERLNGAVAAIGLAALLLVELGSGKGLLSFHAPPILFVQAYTVAAAAALYIKWEKERISVWPEKKATVDEPPVGGDQ